MQRNPFNFGISRRTLIKAAGASAAVAAVGLPGRLKAADPLKVAAIYTVPVEQQWVSRIHKAANAAKERGDIEYVYSENTANNDYERVMREYCEAGHKLILGEVFGVEDAARAVARDYPDVAFLMGSSFKPDAAVPNFSVFDNYIQDASYLSGLVAGAMTKSKNIGMVGGYPIPEVNRLMNAFMAGVKEMAPDASFQVAFIGSWFDPPKAKETPSPRSTAARTCSMPSASASRTRPRSARCWPSATSSTRRAIIPTRWSPRRCGTSSRRSTRRWPRSRPAPSRPPTTASIPS
jgi:basic membrane lipoprotein Med (substrate-binding protein (PBP1-ABC) superfamily)